jgi:hypothetical protein
MSTFSGKTRYAVGIVLSLLFMTPLHTHALDLTGWAWSSNIGWISLNCANEGTCGTVNYKLTKNNTTGKVTGYAWSPYLGWISANSSELTGCPSGTCEFAVSSNGTVSGWIKALGAQNGWDGFISLNGSSYGLIEMNGILTGWAWGDAVTGWVLTSAEGTCATTAGYYCNGNAWMYRYPNCTTMTIIADCGPSGCSSVTNRCVATPPPHSNLSGGTIIRVSPRLVQSGGTINVQWNVSDAITCAVSENKVVISPTDTSGTLTRTVTASTLYEIVCNGGGGTLTGSAWAKVNPKWVEF